MSRAVRLISTRKVTDLATDFNTRSRWLDLRFHLQLSHLISPSLIPAKNQYFEGGF